MNVREIFWKCYATNSGLDFWSDLRTSNLYRVPKKGCHQTHGGNFVKSQLIFIILLPLERGRNFK